MGKIGVVMKKPEIQELVAGSIYRITSLGSREEPMITTGKFLGYAGLGNADAICIELDKSHKKLAGKVRMIPSHMILALDVLKEEKDKDKSDKETMERSYL